MMGLLSLARFSWKQMVQQGARSLARIFHACWGAHAAGVHFAAARREVLTVGGEPDVRHSVVVENPVSVGGGPPPTAREPRAFPICKMPGPSAALVLFLLWIPSIQAQRLFESESDEMAERVDRMYVRGLRYLAQTQTPDGTWSESRYGGEPGVVGLAVVSMLAHGDNPNWGPYSEAIRRGLNFILSESNEQTGYIGSTMYNHGFATLALAEAYGEFDDPRIGPALFKAVELILNAQKDNPLGAWRYSPTSTDADTTVTGCEMVSLFAARNAGVPVPEEAIQKGLKFMLDCQHSSGGFGYTSNSAPNGPRTAIGCLVLTLAEEKQSQAWKSAFKFLQNAPPQGTYHYYYLYYASQAYFHASPEAWQAWNLKNIRELQSIQNEDGSWDGQFGTTFSTSAALLSLALNYRYLPIYER